MHGRANSRHYIFSLSIEEKIAKESFLASRGIACKTHTGPGIVSRISVHHLDHIHSGPQKTCNLFHAPIGLRFFAHPGLKNRADGTPKLFLRIFWEWLSGFFLKVSFIFAD